MSKQVTATFKNRESARLAVEQLAREGFATEDISMLMSDMTRGREFGVVEKSKAPEGVAAGGAIGGTLGAIIAGLSAVATVSVPGLGLIAAGPLLAALTGAGAGAAVGGLAGGLIGLGLPEHEAKLHANAVESGSILVGVFAHDDRVARAREILRSTGGEHVQG
jgi:hypothetical protein